VREAAAEAARLERTALMQQWDPAGAAPTPPDLRNNELPTSTTS
jgi:hypothetical protein